MRRSAVPTRSRWPGNHVGADVVEHPLGHPGDLGRTQVEAPAAVGDRVAEDVVAGTLLHQVDVGAGGEARDGEEGDT